jgi:hypothetical protein
MRIMDPDKYPEQQLEHSFVRLTAQPSLSLLPKVTLSNVKEHFTRGIERQPLQIYDLIAYRSMQPHPLRDEVFRLQTEGEFVKNAKDVRGNIVKLTKLS